VDPGIAPIGSDTDGFLNIAVESMERMHNDPALKGIHMSVGLSNFTVMLPPKCADGSPVKSPLESAFVTMGMPLGLDFIIGNVKRNYALLEATHPAMLCLKDVLACQGYDRVMRVMEYYS
jgi:5-methyltetrahydrofolate--homocysteine methyltransferase